MAKEEAKLIDVRQLYSCKTCRHYGSCDFIVTCDHGEMYSPDFSKLKTIDPESLCPHGRWEVVQVHGICTTFACSECSREVKATNDYFGKPTKHVAKKYPYCHCGAKMEG